MRVAWICVMLGSSCISWAEEVSVPTLDGFTHQTTLSDGEQTLRRVELSYDVLSALERTDRGDLAVFNASGDPVPSRLFDRQSGFETLEQERPLPVFPVQREVTRGEVQYSVQVTNQSEQTAINLSAPANAAPAAEDHVIHVDTDLTQSLGPLTALRLNWAATEQNLIVPVFIEGSDDLKTWTTLVDGDVVSDLKHAGMDLRQDEITLRRTDAEYLRITWSPSSTPLTLLGITGIFSKSRATQPSSATVNCEPASPPNECWLDFGAVPVRTITLETEANEYFLPASLHSRANAERDWVHRGEIQQYRLRVGDTTLTRLDNPLPHSPDPLWKIVFDATTGTAPRQVGISWDPLYLAFIAQGPAPFVLGFGSPRETSNRPETAVEEILTRSRKPVRDLELVAHGRITEHAVSDPFWTRERIETYTLWFVLLIGVGIMSWIAYNLYRRMQSTP